MSEIFKAVVLAAGRGTRMRELTNDLPKPMIPVRRRPILDHIVAGLRAAGIREILLIVGYREDVVRDYFGDGSSHEVSISYERQVVQDGTGRVVDLAKPFVGGDGFILSYGDILLDPHNYPALCKPEGDDAIISVKRSDDVSKGGAVFVNDAFYMTDLREKPGPGEPTSPWYNAGVYFFSPMIFDFTAKLERSPRGEFELTDAIRDLAQSGHRVRAHELTGDWADVRDPEILAELNAQT